MAGELYMRRGTAVFELPKLQRNFVQGYRRLETSERTIDGTLVSDIIATKHRFSVSWPVITGELMGRFVLYYLDGEAVDFGVVNDDATTSWYSCKLSISENVLREIESSEYAYSGFSAEFIEI